MPLTYTKLPHELKLLRQWALSEDDKAPRSTNGTSTFNISVTDPKYFLTFTEALHYSKLFGLNLGFILQADDPFTCIDLDIIDQESQVRKGQPVDPSKWTTQVNHNRYWSMVQHFKSYSEFSKYGKGIHIWVKGSIGAGMRRDGIEVYSQERYIVCTGNTLTNLPLADGQFTLDQMQSQMRETTVVTTLVEKEHVLNDRDIVDMALAAANGDKYLALSNGDWSGYPSQSEADLAFMSMLTFYSKSNEQCRRLFRYSGLGQRDKATRDDKYLNNTLRIIRTREENQSQCDISQIEMAAELIMQLQASKKQSHFMHTDNGVDDTVYDVPADIAFAQMSAPVIQATEEAEGLEWPPGFAGNIARYIYDSAPRPVKEIAIVAALGLLAGICGKGWVITQSGLNMYMILIGRSGVGKEAMHSGISSLMKAVASREPIAMQFINFNEFASGPALIKSVVENQCFVNVAGEWGRKLTRLARDDGRDAAMASLRTVMTDLYQKSGPTSIVGGLTYSSKDNNVASVSGVSFSMIGETTPGTLYECLIPAMMEDGFLSRFNLVSYDGKRQALNVNQLLQPDDALADAIGNLCTQANSLLNRGETTAVQRSADAARIMAAFEVECDSQINSSEDESWRQMWNRAALKVLKLAALLSVADNNLHPVIQQHHLDWSLMLVRKDIAMMQEKMESGDIGSGDQTREKKLISIMRQYLESTELASGYNVNPEMLKDGVITRKYLQSRVGAVSSFTKHPQGASGALNSAIKTLMDNGTISELTQVDTSAKYSFHGRSFRILNVNK